MTILFLILCSLFGAFASLVEAMFSSVPVPILQWTIGFTIVFCALTAFACGWKLYRTRTAFGLLLTHFVTTFRARQILKRRHAEIELQVYE